MMFLKPKTIRANESLGTLDIAMRRESPNKNPTEYSMVYIQDGQAIYANATYNQSTVFTDRFVLGSAIDCAIEFDGEWKRDADNTFEFVTKGEPYIFSVDTNKVLWVQMHQDTKTRLHLAVDVVKVSVIRGWKNIEVEDVDQGLICAYIKSDGAVYYRNYAIQSNGSVIWEPERQVIELLPPIQNITLFRTNDYRTGFIAESNGKIKWILTQRAWAGMAVTPENISAGLKDFFVGVKRISYKEALGGVENISVGITDFSIEHLYAQSDNYIINIANVDNGNGNYGVIIDVELGHGLTNLTASDFTLVDSKNRVFYGVAAFVLAKKKYRIHFSDFNDAQGELLFRCSGEFTTNEAKSMPCIFNGTFTPLNLVPTEIPQPKLKSIWNEKRDGSQIAIEFTEELIGDVKDNILSFTVTGKQYDHVGGVLVDGDYQVDKVERYPITIFHKNVFTNGLKLDAPEVVVTDSKCYETKSGTTLTGTVNANKGDIVLATISHRSTLTVPNGWTKLYESKAIESSQKMAFIIRKVDAAEKVSFTAVQSLADRIYINLMSISGLSDIEHSGLETIASTAMTSFNVPDKNVGDMLIWGCSTNLWTSSSPYGCWETTPNDLTMVSLDQNTTQPRQANFIDLGAGATSGRVFKSSSSAGSTAVVSAVKLITEYNPETVHEFEPIQLTGGIRVKWVDELPTNTSIRFEVATGEVQGAWSEVVNGEIIQANTNVWIRAILSTTDISKSPILKSLCLEESEAPNNIILLTMNPLKRFNNVEGDLAVVYDETKGNIEGYGGRAKGFKSSFTPTNLEKKVNPIVNENIKVGLVDQKVIVTRVFYRDTFNGAENISAGLSDFSITVANVNKDPI